MVSPDKPSEAGLSLISHTLGILILLKTKAFLIFFFLTFWQFKLSKRGRHKRTLEISVRGNGRFTVNRHHQDEGGQWGSIPGKLNLPNSRNQETQH